MSMAAHEEYKGMTATEKLNFFRNKYHAEGANTELGIIAEALNELLPRLAKTEHLRVCTYTLDYSGEIKDDLAAMYDDRMVSEEEVLQFIQSGEQFHPRIITMSQKQWMGVFKSRPESSDSEATP